MRKTIARFRPKRYQHLFLAMLCAAGAWGFIEIADEVAEEESIQFDESILLSLRSPDDLADPIGPIWFEEAARDITALGSLAVLLIASSGALVFLLITGKRHACLLFLLCSLSGIALSQGLKGFFDRARPDLVAHKMHVLTASFPSGHSLLSAVIYLSLGAMLASAQPRYIVKIFILSIASVVTILVGLSRIYLGVHWPSDVLAGWFAGTSWAILWLIVAYATLPQTEQDQSGMEQESPQTPPR